MDKGQVSALMDEIYALAHVLSLLFEQVENAAIKVNPHAVACMTKVISGHIQKISQHFYDMHPP